MSSNKKIFIFGNEAVKSDSLPIRLLPELQRIFPAISFEVKDPNEEWDVPKELTIIDTVIGPKKVTVFNDLDTFTAAPSLSMHDFDALSNLRYMKKLGKLKQIKIIGVPPDLNEKQAILAITKVLRLNFPCPS